VDVTVGPCPAAPTAPPPSPEISPSPSPFADPAPAPTQPALLASPVTVPVLGRILLRDDFSDPNSGWPNPWVDASYGRSTYANGEYSVTRWATASTPTAYTYYQRDSFENFKLEVTARLVSELTRGAVAVGFRVTQPGGFYSFFVQPGTGMYALVLESGGNMRTIVPLTASSAIRRGAERNRLGIQARGSEIVMSVNGQDVGRFRDDTLRSGGIAFGVGTPENREVEARFSDLVVMSIE
jgi:hypothetical protein